MQQRRGEQPPRSPSTDSEEEEHLDWEESQHYKDVEADNYVSPFDKKDKAGTVGFQCDHGYVVIKIGKKKHGPYHPIWLVLGIVMMIFMCYWFISLAGAIFGSLFTPRSSAHEHSHGMTSVILAPPPKHPQPLTPLVTPPPVTPKPTVSRAVRTKYVLKLTEKVRKLKARGVVMEKDPTAMKLSAKLQRATRKLLPMIYGPPDAGTQTYTVRLTLSTPKGFEKPPHSVLSIQTAPIHIMPVAVGLFLEAMRDWEGGSFHRNAGHVVQAMVTNNRMGSMPFQEYSPRYPHVYGTMGFAGRPGGPAFYISTVDNTNNHGPGSQGSKYEADSCFGKVVEDRGLLKWLSESWGRPEHKYGPMDGNGFMENDSQFIKIVKTEIIGLNGIYRS